MARLKVNDYVKIAKHKATVCGDTEYIYGTVAGFNHGTAMVVINLATPYKGSKSTTVPAYMASALTKVEYEAFTHKDEFIGIWEAAVKILSGAPTLAESYVLCDHAWANSGFNPNTGDEWFNCSICGIAKENA